MVQLWVVSNATQCKTVRALCSPHISCFVDKQLKLAEFHFEPEFLAQCSLEASREIVEQTKLFKITVSFGNVVSLITLPCFMSHASIPAEVRAARGLPDSLVRISVGIEDPEDLIKGEPHAISQERNAMIDNFNTTCLHTSTTWLYLQGACLSAKLGPSYTIRKSPCIRRWHFCTSHCSNWLSFLAMLDSNFRTAMSILSIVSKIPYPGPIRTGPWDFQSLDFSQPTLAYCLNWDWSADLDQAMQKAMSKIGQTPRSYISSEIHGNGTGREQELLREIASLKQQLQNRHWGTFWCKLAFLEHRLSVHV